MFSSNARNHQRPFGWGAAATNPTSSSSQPQPPNTPPTATAAVGGNNGPTMVGGIAGRSASTGSVPMVGTLRPSSATNGGGTNVTTTTPNTTTSTAPAGSGSGSSALFRSGMLQQANSSGASPAAGNGGGNSATSATGSLGSFAQQQRSLSAGSVPIGSALNATRATHNTGGGAGGSAAFASIGGGSGALGGAPSPVNSQSSLNTNIADTNTINNGSSSNAYAVEDYSKHQMQPGVMALRATNVVNPSGMTSEQTQRLAGMLSATTSAAVLAPAGAGRNAACAAGAKGFPTATPSSSSSSTSTVKRNPITPDDRSQLQATLKGRSSAGQLAIAEVHTKLRAFEMFHYWTTQPDTQEAIAKLIEDSLGAVEGGAGSNSTSQHQQQPKISPRNPFSSAAAANGGSGGVPGNPNGAMRSPRTLASDNATLVSPSSATLPSEDAVSRPMAAASLSMADEANNDAEEVGSGGGANTGRSNSFHASSYSSAKGGGANTNNNNSSVGSIPRLRDDIVGDSMVPALAAQNEEEVAEPTEAESPMAPALGTMTAGSVGISIDITAPQQTLSDSNTASPLRGGIGGPTPSASSPTEAGSSSQRHLASQRDQEPTMSVSSQRLAKSPRSGTVALPCPPSATSSLDGSIASKFPGGAGFHIVDEVDAAHARGGLSPRVGTVLTASNGKLFTSSTTGALNASVGGGGVGAVGGAETPLNNSLRSGGAHPDSAHTPNRSAANTPNRTRSPTEGISPNHHNGASNALLESNQQRPPSPLIDIGRAKADGARSPSPSLRDSREGSSSNIGGGVGTSIDGNIKSLTTPTMFRTNSGTGQRPNIPKASTPRGAAAASGTPTAGGGSSRGQSPPPPPAKKYATYDDIPRFYFGEGKPDSGRSVTISTPHYKRHENPHLKAFDGIAIPPAQLEQIKAAAAAAEAEKKANGGTSPKDGKKKKNSSLAGDDSTSPGKTGSKQAANSESFSLSTLDPAAFAGLNIPQPGYKLAPMMPLVVMEDQDVGTFIAKEFAKVPGHPGPAPQPIMPPANAARGTSAGPKGRMGTAGGKKGALGAGAGAAGANATPTNQAAINAHAKQEAAYRQALFTCMTNIVTQAYGLPRYYAAPVCKKLMADGLGLTSSVGGDTTPNKSAAAAVGGAVGPNAVPNTNNNANAANAKTPITIPTVEGVPSGVITATQAKEFYDRYMRFRDPIRRFFDALIICNVNSNSEGPSAATAGGASSTASATGGINTPSPTGGSAGANSGSTAGSPANNNLRNYLIREDFIPYLDALLDLHPGLGFLRQTADFQAKYVETILVRLFFECDTHDRGRISWPEFERSKLPDAIRQVDVAEDINAVLNFFSYEHFYVIYCRFWELDGDRDMLIDATDLIKYYQEGTANAKVIERIFQGHGRKLMAPPAPAPPAPKGAGKGGALTLAQKRAAAAAAAADPAGIANKRMGYEDFVWFCLAEEDKSSPRAIRYWFKVLDLDADGIICGWELEQFYNCTREAMIAITTECISFEDIMCQIVDMVPALSEGHSALDRSFDRQRIGGGLVLPPPSSTTNTKGGGANNTNKSTPDDLSAPLRTVSLSDKVRRRSSLTAGPLLPLGPSAAILKANNNVAAGNGIKGAGGGSKASPPLAPTGSSAASLGSSSSTGGVMTVVDDPRHQYHRFGLTLRDLLASPESAHVALNMVLNVVKFLMFEQKDPFVSHHDRLMGGYEGTEWDRFARAEYDRMASEADE